MRPSARSRGRTALVPGSPLTQAQRESAEHRFGLVDQVLPAFSQREPLVVPQREQLMGF